MHSYLRAIGFSNIKNRKMLKPILREVMANPTKRTISTISTDTRLIQLDKDFGEGFGISIVGELDINGDISVEYHFPYVRSKCVLEHDRIFVEEHGDKTSYAGVCDDFNMTMMLIFFMTNVAEYENTKWMNRPHSHVSRSNMACLSTQGKIILDVDTGVTRSETAARESDKRRRLIEAAKKGNSEALETLTIEDIDNYARIKQRVQQEDIYSIVDTSFAPFGIETEHYTTVARIMDVGSFTNVVTGEEVWLMTLEANDLSLRLAINKKDLVGEPAPGRRFKGEVWLQGHICF